ncbi:hypothetical protein ES288_A07G192100v1 [Gossypium darwinii]|uniref:Uncharacterized protein n=1 Tax=Gossypium darwinii TaxID=34276 RepID=A0A5D2FZQ2_GOSDA|nr:hypothetical protein ES288_A07G192100v1 [Gossypium darwinii]
MEQIGGTGHENYLFKGKMRVDPVKTCTGMLFDFSKEKFEIFTLPLPPLLFAERLMRRPSTTQKSPATGEVRPSRWRKHEAWC